MSGQGEVQTLDAFKSNVEDMALEELSRLRVRREAVASELTALDGSIRSVRKILGTLNPPTPKQRKARESQTKVGDGVRTRFIEWAAGREGDITTALIASELGVGKSYANMLAKQMREEGILRLSATSGPSNIYRSEV